MTDIQMRTAGESERTAVSLNINSKRHNQTFYGVNMYCGCLTVCTVLDIWSSNVLEGKENK